MQEAIEKNDNSEVIFILNGVSPHLLDIRKANIKSVENRLGRPFPDFYKNTMLEFPFPGKSVVNRLLLLDFHEMVEKELPDYLYRVRDQGYEPFFIGKDFDDTLFFLDLANYSDKVYSFDRKTGGIKVFTKTWDEYLRKINELMQNIEKEMEYIDEQFMQKEEM